MCEKCGDSEKMLEISEKYRYGESKTVVWRE